MNISLNTPGFQMNYTNRSVSVFVVLMSLFLLGSVPLEGRGRRHEKLTKAMAKGPEMKVVGATFFGAGGDEEFVAAGQLSNGTILAFGNAWGPEFPDVGSLAVLGDGMEPAEGGTGGSGDELDRTIENRAGMIVFYNRDLTNVIRAVRFDWGVAAITVARVIPGSNQLIIAGEAGPKFSSIRGSAGSFQKANPAGAKNDVFVMSLDDRGRPNWTWYLPGHDSPPRQLWINDAGVVRFELDYDGTMIAEISPDGSKMNKHKIYEKHEDGRADIKTILPNRDAILFGGDRNTHTGREPWRQPYLKQYNRQGEVQWRIWAWDSERVGRDKYRLVSDSAVKHAVYDPEHHDAIIAGWSDGGNSVFTRQPTDLDQGAPEPGSPFSIWGAKGAISVAYLLRVDLDTHKQTNWTRWLSYNPETFFDKRYRGAPNSIGISDLRTLPNGHFGIAGSAATGLIQTPNAFWDMPEGYEGKYGGKYVAVFHRSMNDLFFSSYLPGYTDVHINRTRNGVLVTGPTTGTDDLEEKWGQPTKTPSARGAAQENMGGGSFDSHIIYLRFPR